jgi:nucleotidyltransferase/DNA polymerase involved in DNA repair
MGRFIRWTALALVVVVVTGTVILVITVRPGLQDDAQEVRQTWKPLLQPLTSRYGALGGVATALEAAGNGDRATTKQLKRALSDWALLKATTDDASQADTADELETLASRIRATVAASKRLNGNAALTAAIASFDSTKVPPTLINAYNDVVLRYERNRDGVLRGIVANLDGYEPHPTLQLATPIP